ncbi:MAG: hypothetical protein AAFX99_24920, partial [Myxococcota bacterium]
GQSTPLVCVTQHTWVRQLLCATTLDPGQPHRLSATLAEARTQSVHINMMRDLLILHLLCNAVGSLHIHGQQHQHGRIYMSEGDIVFAQTEAVAGRSALIAMMSWSAPRVSALLAEPRPQANVHVDASELAELPWKPTGSAPGFMYSFAQELDADSTQELMRLDDSALLDSVLSQDAISEEEMLDHVLSHDGALSEDTLLDHVLSHDGALSEDTFIENVPSFDLGAHTLIEMELSPLRTLEGFVGAALLDRETLRSLGYMGFRGIDSNTLAHHVLHYCQQLTQLKTPMDGAVVVGSDTYHILQQLHDGERYLYYVGDLQSTNLMLACMTLDDVATAFSDSLLEPVDVEAVMAAL